MPTIRTFKYLHLESFSLSLSTSRYLLSMSWTDTHDRLYNEHQLLFTPSSHIPYIAVRFRHLSFISSLCLLCFCRQVVSEGQPSRNLPKVPADQICTHPHSGKCEPGMLSHPGLLQKVPERKYRHQGDYQSNPAEHVHYLFVQL